MNNLSLIKKFPKDFIFGTATSSYQIEGNGFGDSGRNHWDQFAKIDGMVAQLTTPKANKVFPRPPITRLFMVLCFSVTWSGFPLHLYSTRFQTVT